MPKNKIEEEEIPEEPEEVEEVITPEKQAEEFLIQIEQRFKRDEAAITTNQKFIKKLWDRQKVTEDNLRIHLEDKNGDS